MPWGIGAPRTTVLAFTTIATTRANGSAATCRIARSQVPYGVPLRSLAVKPRAAWKPPWPTGSTRIKLSTNAAGALVRPECSRVEAIANIPADCPRSVFGNRPDVERALKTHIAD